MKDLGVVNGPRALAQLLIGHIADADMVSLQTLAHDPVAALEANAAVRISWVEPESLPVGCSIAAACDKSRDPARLLISKDASPGRRRFSILHEYAHLLRDFVPSVLEALFMRPDGGAALEERICDEFASTVLLLDAALGPQVTASAVHALIVAAPASAEACAVAAARKLPAPGYVMILAPDGTARFTAHNSDVYYVRRGAVQGGLLAQASTGRSIRGREQVRYGTGNHSREMFLDAETQDGRTIAVLVTDSPPWGGLTIGTKRGPEGSEGYCDNCAHGYTVFSPACATCEQPPCPQCGECACGTPKGVSGERACDRCYLILPPAAYPSANSTSCTECS